MEQYTIRRQIEERLLARRGDLSRVAKAAGISTTALSEWRADLRNRRLGDEQLDRLAQACGYAWVLAPVQPTRDDARGE